MQDNDIIDRIGRLAKDGAQPERVRTQAGSLHEALTRPKTVAVMGPPDSGKADVLALLAGKPIVDPTLALGTVRLSYGAVEKTVMTMADGNTLKLDRLPSDAVVGSMFKPVETWITAPLPALKKVSLMRLAEVNEVDGQIRAMLWAAKNSDILIWCTKTFTKVEHHMWSHIPNRMRDHAFALATSADDFGGDLAIARTNLETKAADDFAFVHAIDLARAIKAAFAESPSLDEMRDSGAAALVSELLAEINHGRQNTLERAAFLIESSQRPAQAAEAPAPTETVIPNVKVDKAVADHAIKDLAKALKNPDDGPVRASRKAKSIDPDIFPVFELDDAAPKAPAKKPATAPAEAVAAPSAPAAPPLSAEALLVCKDIVMRLGTLGSTLVKDQGTPRALFDASLKTLSFMDEQLQDVANDNSPELVRLSQMTEEATDLIQLLRLEGDAAATVDAVTVLLQIKRNLCAAIAA